MYAGPGGNVGVITRTSPHDGFRGRSAPNPTGHKTMVESQLPCTAGEPERGETRYCDVEANGIIPGYGGHRPRAQHCYGRSSFGDPNGVSHASQLRKANKGSLERGAEDEFASGFGNGVGIDGPMFGHPDTKGEDGVWQEGIPDHAKQVGGVLPGYGGHVPRAIHKYGGSAVGSTPQFGGSAEHEEVAELRAMFSRSPEVRGLENGDFVRSDPNDDGEEWWPKSPPVAAIEGVMVDYRQQINGVLPKYAGHVPRAKDIYGKSAHGYTRTIEGVDTSQMGSNSGVNTGNLVMGQVNRENTKSEVPFRPKQRLDGNGVIPGYRGHVANVQNAIGMSTFLSGPGFTEVKVEEMEKMGGVGDLGDSAAAYGCNDWGASSFTDADNEFADKDGDGQPDGFQNKGKDAASQAGHVDQYTFGDAMADKAAAAVEEAKKKKKRFDEAKKAARGF